MKRSRLAGMHVLLVEDDAETAAFIQKGLWETGHAVDIATTGPDGLDMALHCDFDAAVVDRMLPGLDGLALIAALRKAGRRIPVLILSALGQVDHRVEGLRAGGDDYLAKPFAFSELEARLAALARRAGAPAAETSLCVGDLEVDLLSRKIMRDGHDISLQPREFALLEFLMRHAGQVVTRTMLLEHVWGYHFDPQTNVIDVHISRLRGKIDKGFAVPLLHTVRGAGYCLRAEG
jgi:two-component system OmpR family response regulator